MQRHGRWWLVGIAAAMFASGCAGSDAQVSVSDESAGSAITTDDGDLFTDGQPVTTGGPPVTMVDDQEQPVDDQGRPVEPVTESLPPVPETGVPGIESDDDFCRAWSVYAGSFQAITTAWALQPPAEAARLEVAASAALRDSVEEMSAAFPSEIEANRQALTVDVVGPFLRRAERAAALLGDAGLDDAQIDRLGQAWVTAITEQGVESERLSIDVADGTADALDGASEAFAAELPSAIEDPTLDTTEFDISPSLDYITATCPDQGTLAGNDVIESDGN